MKSSSWLTKLKNKVTPKAGEEEKITRPGETEGELRSETKADKGTGPDKEVKEGFGEENRDTTDSLAGLKARYDNVSKENIWVFYAGNDGQAFRGNPKYLFIYINRYRPDLRAWWMCMDPDTLLSIRALGYDAFSTDSPEARYLLNRTGVMAAEQVKAVIPEGISDVKYLNLWHGVGFKRIERRLYSGDIAMGIAKKYIVNGTFFRDRQLVTVTSPMIEKEFITDMGVDSDQLIRTGYLRCLYQQNFEPVVTFDHDLKKRKGLPESAHLAVYAPTYRARLGGTFSEAMQDLEALHACCAARNLLLIFKLHPNMEKEAGFLYAKEKFGDYPYFWFWDNQDDFYEIMDQIDLAILDYSSILSDMVAVGIKHYIRYIYDFESYMQDGLTVDDYENRTTGRICRTFPDLLEAIGSCGQEDLTEDIKRINELFWSYSGGRDDFEKTIRCVMDFEIKKRTYPVLYSFDIFDTLISRKVLHPFGVFYLVREKMQEKGGFPRSLVLNYPSIRHTAESNVREYYKKSTEERKSLRVEITFDLIFERMADVYGLTPDQVEDLKSWELSAELDQVVPLHNEISCLKELLDRGEQVVLISDMYLPADFIRKLLAKADPVLADLPLFVSSEYGVQKVSKDLFFEVYKSFEPFYDFRKWIHYGDNYNADRKAPVAMGIVTRTVRKPEFGRFQEELTDRLDTYDGYLVAALQARMLQENRFRRDRFVINFVSLCMVSYVDWVLRDSMRRGYETLYFISRDGWHLKRAADAIIRRRGLPIRTKYIYASRKTWRIPSFIHEVDEGFWRPYGNFSGITSKEKLLGAMDIDEESFKRLIPDIDLDKVDWNNKFEVNSLADIIKQSGPYRRYLLEKAAGERDLVCRYLRQEIDESESFAFVEYWGRGFTQDCMTRLWQDITGSGEPSVYYYSRSVEPSVPGSIRYNFTTNDNSQLFMENIFANMPYKSVKAYKEEDGEILPVLESCRYDKELYASMETLLPQFAEAYAGLELTMPEDTDRMLYEFILNYQKEHEDDMDFVAELGSLSDSSSAFGRTREYAPPYTMEDLDRFEKKARGRKDNTVTCSPVMSALRSPEDVRNRYMDMYQILPGERLDSGKLLDKKMQEAHKKYRMHYENLLDRANDLYEHYLLHAGREKVEDLITLVTDAGGLEGSPLEPVYKLLMDAGTGSDDSPAVRILDINKEKDDPDTLAGVLAVSRFILISEPVPLFCRIYFREETRLILLCRSAFPIYNQGMLTEYGMKWRTKYWQLGGWNDISLLQIPSKNREEFFVRNYLSARTASCALTGCCPTDLYYDPACAEDARRKLGDLFPASRSKKVILYMPAARKSDACPEWYNILDIEILHRALSDDYVLALAPAGKFSPDQCRNTIEIPGFSKLMTKGIRLRELMVSADVIVGDYRDEFFEAALLKKPVYSTASDYEIRIKLPNMSMNARDFESFLFCPVVSSSEELITALKDVDHYDYGPMEDFAASMLDGCDGDSSKRVVDYLLRERMSD